MRFTLRPYQEEAIKMLRDSVISGKKRPILCLPTGAGKTVTFSHLADLAIRKGNKVMVLCHRRELISQARNTMYAYGVDVSMVYFEMVETLARKKSIPQDFKMCIIDECHTANFFKILDILPEHVQVIGATATPISASNKNPLRNFFDEVVNPVSISDLIAQGSLSEPVYDQWVIDSSKLQKQGGEYSIKSQETALFSPTNLNEALERRVGKTIIFTASIKMAQDVADLCDCEIVHSKMSDDERNKVVDRFKKDGNILVNCSILTTGFDDPAIETVIIYRATTSLSLWLQMCGRGSRVIPNFKNKFYIFDLGGNIKRHGTWHADRNWKEIFQLQGLKKKQGEAALKKCKNEDCQAFIFASSKVCPYCGFEQPIKAKKETVADKILRHYYNGQVPDLEKPWASQSVEELVLTAQSKGYKIDWVAHQIYNRPTRINDLYKLAKIADRSRFWVEKFLSRKKSQL
jgi:superfamily II DNA or RNA helicase